MALDFGESLRSLISSARAPNVGIIPGEVTQITRYPGLDIACFVVMELFFQTIQLSDPCSNPKHKKIRRCSGKQSISALQTFQKEVGLEDRMHFGPTLGLNHTTCGYFPRATGSGTASGCSVYLLLINYVKFFEWL